MLMNEYKEMTGLLELNVYEYKKMTGLLELNVWERDRLDICCFQSSEIYSTINVEC